MDDNIVDQKEIFFGIRTVAFDPTNGFLLNGKHYELYGTCNHQDHAGVGAALPDALQEFRVKKLKEFGCNAIRTAHNPPTPELLDACDRLGILVMDESRLLGSDSENLRKWDDQIRRDRNHPCVAIWSIANEEFAVQDSPQAAEVARTMQNLAKRLDPTRPVTYAAPEGDNFWGINGVIEVRGWNYHPGPDMDKYHAEHPNAAECRHRAGQHYLYARNLRNKCRARLRHSPMITILVNGRRALRRGGVGLPTAPGFPVVLSGPVLIIVANQLRTVGHASIHILASSTRADFKKMLFTTTSLGGRSNPVLHLLPHWNWPGKEGQEIRVDAYSNCKQVELFLNGSSLGKQDMKANSKLTWNVSYAPGVLSAKGFDAIGNVIAETKQETTGEPTQIRLTPDRETINADGEDVAVFAVDALDAQGRLVPTAQNKIDFSIEGMGKIIGVGNGDPSCHEPDVFIVNVPVRAVALADWRWTPAKISEDRKAMPECGKDFDDSNWKILRSKASDNESTIKTENTTAIYRAHVTMTDEDLNSSGVQIRFSGCDDEGWFFVNKQFIGESHDWSAQPTFDIKDFLHAGDNIIAVKVKNISGVGGLNPNVSLDVIGKASVPPWSRSLFNGRAEIIVQSTRDDGEFKLTASSDGMMPFTASVQTQPCKPRPSVP